MTRRETIALRLFLPPSDHLLTAGDGPRVVLQQHPAQHVHRGQLAQPGRCGAVIDHLQQRIPVAGVGNCQLIAPGLVSELTGLALSRLNAIACTW